MQVNITFTNKNPDTIYNKLAARLGRLPSNDEIVTELNRIIKMAKDLRKE